MADETPTTQPTTAPQTGVPDVTAPTDPLLAELAWRGLLYQTTEGLAEHLGGGVRTAYCGFDPTASSLHVGNLLPIMGLLRLQRAGHRPVALVGGGTGMIGDPSGRTQERQLHGRHTVEANTAAIRSQLERFLDFDGSTGARMADNAEWLVPLDVLGFLRDVGKHFSVNVMLAKESVRTRMETGISYTEFSYMLLQAYDFVELRRRYGVTIQLGGSDQWGNITSGTELVRRMDGAQAHGLTFPLLTTSSGEKFGKSAGNAVWLDAERTSPFAFHQFWINVDDREVGRLLRFYTLMPREQILALDRATAERPHLREAQRALAAEVTTRVHGPDAARVAEEVGGLLFAKGDPRELSPAALAALAREVPYATVAAPDGVSALDAAELFVAAGLAKSKGEARRLLEQGGLTVSGRRLTAGDRALGEGDLLGGGYLLLRRGARDHALVRAG
ncbi:MAG TPA: tyrosine--tRNA ligase [Gemmatirosa sp.]|nr:tyrosine--tRNA ligase [Gemmatirosa sp.]